jgi:3-hydroxyanthranilate 3,4-dioxygenase
MADIKLHFPTYIEENKTSLDPPVCNKMIHNLGKLRVMIVGGPNQRKDYHMNLGEELFYMMKGDMCLKIMEHGKPKDVAIREGEIFMLPSRIPHSPQRFENTLGLVIERFRPKDELDGLRYFVDDSNQEVLWQRFFHVTDLGQQLKPLIAEFFASDEFRSRKPSPSLPKAAWEPNTDLTVPAPFPLEKALADVASNSNGVLELFKCPGEFTTLLIREGWQSSPSLTLPLVNECWVWMLGGEGKVNGTAVAKDETLLAVHGLQSIDAGVGFLAMLVFTTH